VPRSVPGSTLMGRVMGLDLGSKRIGVAVTDPLRMFARPLTTISASGALAADVEQVLQLAAENEARLIVVGHPLLPSGDRGEQALEAERFAEALSSAASLPVELWDESYSTLTASERLAEAGSRRAASRSGIDAAAAAVILEEWLRHQEQTGRDSMGERT